MALITDILLSFFLLSGWWSSIARARPSKMPSKKPSKADLARIRSKAAERQRRWRIRQKAKIDRLEKLEALIALHAPSDNPKIVPAEEAWALADEIAIIAGYQLDALPLHWMSPGPGERVRLWLASGWKPEIIRAVCRAVVARKRDGPPKTISYFEQPLARAHTVDSNPLPSAAQSSFEAGFNHGTAGKNDLASALAKAKQWVADVRAEATTGGLCRSSDEIDRIAPTRGGG